MMILKTYDAANRPDDETKQVLIHFLKTHLEQYGDQPIDIAKAIDYALKLTDSFGGFLILAYEEDTLVGAVVVNATGMKGYIPENILVYIATHSGYRGRGIGKSMMKKAIERAEGDIALHVEKDNPAKFLYESLGFTNPYLEMRLKKASN